MASWQVATDAASLLADFRLGPGASRIEVHLHAYARIRGDS